MEEHKLSCNFKRTGRLTGAISEPQLGRLSAEAETLKRTVGIQYEILSRADLADELGTDAYVGARLLSHHGGLDPAQLVAGLTTRAEAEGALILERTPLTGYASCGDGFELKTDRGTFKAGDLILATNGYMDKAAPFFRRRIVPLTSYMIATEELSETLMAKLFRKSRMVTDTNRLLCYYRPSPDGRRILFGGRPAYTEISLETSAERLMDYLVSLFPELDSVGVTHSWYGMIGYSFDHLPHVGRIDDLHYAAGYCGSGVVMSTWLGRKVANRVLGRPDGKTAFAEINHPTHFP